VHDDDDDDDDDDQNRPESSGSVAATGSRRRSSTTSTPRCKRQLECSIDAGRFGHERTRVRRPSAKRKRFACRGDIDDRNRHDVND